MKIDFSEYRFRASQVHKIMAGTIGLTDNEKSELSGLLKRKMDHSLGNKDEKGKPIKALTPNMLDRVDELTKKKKDKTLPKTMQSELRRIHRMETYKRNFPFTNKYVQKGIQQEEEAITNYQMYLMAKGVKTLFTKNEKRFYNAWLSGEPDIIDNPKKITEGWDTKASWDLSTFPFPSDELDPQYKGQNQSYMDLTGARKWTTVYCLVNSTEHQLNNEKMKWFYAFNQPDEENNPEQYHKMVEKQKEVERMMVFDWDRFKAQFPFHHFEHTEEEWKDSGYDIPLAERVIEKVSIYSPEYIMGLQERIKISRNYLNSL